MLGLGRDSCPFSYRSTMCHQGKNFGVSLQRFLRYDLELFFIRLISILVIFVFLLMIDEKYIREEMIKTWDEG